MDCFAIPESTGQILTPAPTTEALENAVFGAQPGDHVLIAPGTYHNAQLLFANGDLAMDMIIARAEDPSSPPLFTGRNTAEGDNYALVGATFDDEGTGDGGRMLRVRNSDAAVLAYLEFSKGRNIAIELDGGVVNSRVHRVHVRGMNVDENENGAEAIKAGVSGTGPVLRNNLIDHCFIEDTLRERESVSIKEGGLTLFRVTFSNTKDLSVRHAVAARIEECVGMRRISLNGADHFLLNSEAVEAIEVRSGSFDGATSYEKIPDGESAIYMSAHDNRIENSAGPLAVGHVAGDASAFVADGTLVADHDGVITTTEPAGYEDVAPSSERADPVRVSAQDTGLAGWSYCESR